MFDFDAESGEIWIHDEIGPAWWGLIEAEQVKAALREIAGKHAVVRLNTPGGSVDHGIAIFNLLREHKGGVTTIVDSLAASMGSYLLQAGERRIVSSNSMVMIHDPWTIGIGNSAQMRKEADVLDKHALRMIPDYAARSGKTNEEITAIMTEESWYVGQEIIDAGFADEMQTQAKGQSFAPVLGHQLPTFAKHMPEGLKAAAMQGKQSTERKPLTLEQRRESIAARTASGELPAGVVGAKW